MNYIIGANQLVDTTDLVKFLSRLALNLVFATIVIRFVYYRLYRDREYVFTYFAFNVITFCMCLLLRKVPIELGFALGLFAVFGILRYRTEPIRIRDLTYLFIVIGLGILNGVANKKISVAELLAVNAVITAIPVFLELGQANRTHRSQYIIYDNIELLKPENEAALFDDLSDRIGLRVVRVQIDRIDMLRDAAHIIAFYVKSNV